MNESREFSFGDNSVANAYDNALVPILFEPWAARLVEEHRPWEGRRVLDLATGTGIVARLLAERVGPGGGVPHAVEVAYSTPIGPKLRALPEVRQDQFRKALAERLHELSDDGTTMGRMVSNVVSAEKPA